MTAFSMPTVQITNTATKASTVSTLTSVQMALIRVVQMQAVKMESEIIHVSANGDFMAMGLNVRMSMSVRTTDRLVTKKQAVQITLALIHVNVTMVTVEMATIPTVMIVKDIGLKDVRMLMNVLQAHITVQKALSVIILMAVLLVLV